MDIGASTLPPMSKKQESLVRQTPQEELLEELGAMRQKAIVDARMKFVYENAFAHLAYWHFELSAPFLKTLSKEKMLLLQDVIFEKAKKTVRWKKPLYVAGFVSLMPFLGVGYFLLRDARSKSCVDFPELKIVLLHDEYKTKFGAYEPR